MLRLKPAHSLGRLFIVDHRVFPLPEIAKAYQPHLQSLNRLLIRVVDGEGLCQPFAQDF